jgi:hypothetical protein
LEMLADICAMKPARNQRALDHGEAFSQREKKKKTQTSSVIQRSPELPLSSPFPPQPSCHCIRTFVPRWSCSIPPARFLMRCLDA